MDFKDDAFDHFEGPTIEEIEAELEEEMDVVDFINHNQGVVDG